MREIPGSCWTSISTPRWRFAAVLSMTRCCCWTDPRRPADDRRRAVRPVGGPGPGARPADLPHAGGCGARREGRILPVERGALATIRRRVGCHLRADERSGRCRPVNDRTGRRLSRRDVIGHAPLAPVASRVTRGSLAVVDRAFRNEPLLVSGDVLTVRFASACSLRLAIPTSQTRSIACGRQAGAGLRRVGSWGTRTGCARP